MNVFSDQLVLWVINVLIHSTVLTAVLLCVATLFRRRAAMRYWILCCGLLLVLASPAVSALVQSRGIGWLALALPNETVPVTSVAATKQPTPVNDAPMQSLPTQQVDRTIMPPVLDASSMEEVASAPLMSKPMMAADVPANPSVATPAVKDSRSPMQWLAIIVTIATVVWAVGAMLLLMRMTIGWIRLAGILRRAEPITDPDYVAALTKASAAAGCHDECKPRLVASDEISGPLAAGIFAGSVVLPKGLIAKSNPTELAEVLVHEVAHVVRRDPIVVLLQNLVAAIYWPHPLVRKLNRELAKAREEVCDNFVLATTDAPIYSRTLLSLAQLVQQPETIPGSVGFFASRWRLEQRVAGLLDEARDTQTVLSKRGWGFVLVSATALLTAICVGTLTIATAQNASQDSATAAGDGSDSVTISGIVRAPDGEPVGGVRVVALQNFRANTAWTTDSIVLAETQSNQMGRYQMQVEPDSDRFSNGMHLEKEHLSVLATLAGFGPDEQTFFDDRTKVDLQLANARQEVVGQVVNLEGKPIQGVRVRLIDIQQPPSMVNRSEVVDKWVEAVKSISAGGDKESDDDPFGGSTRTPQMAFYPSAEHFRGIAALNIQTLSDDEGRFRFADIGDDRLAMLQIDGAGIASSLIPVVAREMSPLNTPWMGPQYRTGKTFGNQFRLSAEPEQIVQGVVKDRKTGEPIGGASISLYQLPDDLLVINGFLSTTSDAEGRYVLSGIPRNTKQSGGEIKIKVHPPSDQPYFRSEHSVPVIGGLEPIRFDIQLTRGIWATGKVTQSDSGESVTGLVGYHPYIDNPNAADHEAFNAGMTSMGYEEMFATDADGSFRVPALRGKGVLRAIAENDDHFELETVPGTRMNTVGNVKPGERMVYHNIMPGNGVVEIDIDNQADSAKANISLKPVRKLMVNVVNPDGTPASGFRVAGRHISKRMTLSGRGKRYWDDRPSSSSTVTVLLGNEKERDRPLVISDKPNNSGAVVWLNQVDDTQSILTVTLKANAKIVGKLISQKPSDLDEAYLQAGVGDAGTIRAMFPTEDGSQIKVNKNLPFALNGVLNLAEDGQFEWSVPPSERCSLLLRDFPGEPLLLDNHSAPPGSTINLGTIDLSADPKTWPTPVQIQTNSDSVSGQVLDPNGKPIEATLWFGGPARSGGWSQTRTSVTWTQVGKSTADGRFQISLPKSITSEVKSETLTFRIAATAEGLGFAWANVTPGKLADDVTLQLAKDTPIRGRIVTLDGTPAADVRLDVVSVFAPDALPESADLIANAPLSSGVYTNWPSWSGGSPLTKSVVTDNDGKFQLSGLGSERRVRLQALGDGLAATRLSIVTREKPSDSADGVIAVRTGLSESSYFTEFTHVAVPGRIVRGTVVDRTTGQPIPDVSIIEPTSWTSRAKPAVTDAEGKFVIRHVPKATQYKLQLSPKNATHFRSELNVPDTTGSEPLDVELTLTTGIRLRGRVVDEVSGEGVRAEIIYNPLFPNDAIELLGVERVANPLSKVQTEADGRFEIAVLDGRGAISAEVSGEEYATVLLKEKDLREIFPDGDLEARPDAMGQFNYLPTAGGGQSRGIMGLSQVQAVMLLNPNRDDAGKEVKLLLRRSRTVQGELFDPQGKPVSGVTVIGLGPSPVSMTDEPLETNRFSVTGLLPDSVRTLLFLHPERSLGAVVNVNGDETDTVNVTLNPTGSVSGSLFNLDGDPITRGYVNMSHRKIRLRTGLWEATIDDEGRFQVDNVPAGEAFSLFARTDAQRMEMIVQSDVRAEADANSELGAFRQKDKYRFEPDELSGELGEKELQP
ncbi:M56 family metallopeptidase [Allorhodopirellula solitaria]|uniref:Regulatory protein BlaR1 n=1 Tax=Allorhodopirellula solitaria TaxID=2527987 RepID=A0A5C5XVZ1_9BACT|nr:M56 family metallopeptidase [Allorhodopirellula solitaria]TWT66691.1 Regulatory protein BlaR1 [Allorhodopirellula solitaria]